MLELRMFTLDVQGKANAPLQCTSVSKGGMQILSPIFFPFDILQCIYEIQTAWFLCRSALSKCADNCVLNHFAWQQPIKIRQCFCLAFRPKYERITLQCGVTEHCLCWERWDFISWAWLLLLTREKMFSEDFPWTPESVSALLLSWKICFTRQITEL